MFDRRRLIVSVAALAACAPRNESNLAPIWLRVTPDGAGYTLRIEGEIVPASDLEEALLDHAVTANPGLTREAAREQVRIYVQGDPGLPITWLSDLLPVLNCFEKVGFVAEDRRG